MRATRKEKKALQYLAEEHHAEWCAEYGEPGYSQPEKGVILCNWNNTPKGLADWLESCGFSLEWFDEWTISYSHGKAYRTEPDCYSWEPSAIVPPDWCEYLVRDDGVAEWIETLASDRPGQPMGMLPSWVEPSELEAAGFALRDDSQESGFFPGQTDNPQECAKRAFTDGAARVVFRKTEQSQFYAKWQCWVEMGDEALEWFTSSSGSVEFQVKRGDVAAVATPGPNDAAVAELLAKPYIVEQLAKIPADAIRRELREFGAWDDEELRDEEQNKARILWNACWDISEKSA